MLKTLIRNVLLGILAATGLATTAQATPDFAKKENQKCNYCHLASGKNPRNFRGIYYKRNGFSLANFDNEAEAKLAGVKPDAVGNEAAPTNTTYPNVKVTPALSFTVKDIQGKPVNLARYQGSVILVVNVASKCGNTPQYASLEKLYEKYKGVCQVICAFSFRRFAFRFPSPSFPSKG